MKEKNKKVILILSVFMLLAIGYLSLNPNKYDSVTSNKVNSKENSNLIGFYIQDDSSDTGYSKTDTVPSSGYTFNEEQSYCTIDGNRDDNITLKFDAETQMLTVSPMTTSGTKCYLYFDKQASIKDTLLTYYPNVLTRTDFNTTVTNTTTGTIYKSADSSQYDEDGEVYYFAGNPTDSWVKFADFYWRIVRINGDGTVRLIFQGTSANTTGTGTQIGTSAFNAYPNSNRSEYVGLKYTEGNQHGTTSNSTIITELNDWYQTNLASYASYIDTGAGFCSDRDIQSGYTWSSQPSSTIYYAPYERIVTNTTASLDCSPEDVLSVDNKRLTYPIGLITADEVVYGGIPWYQNGSATSNYLYTGQNYWTMSPYHFNIIACIFIVHSYGYLSNSGDGVTSTNGVRPVINLRSDVIITSGNGTATSPFQIG